MPLILAVAAVAGLVLLAAMSAFLSGIETALFSIREWRLHRWRKQDPKGVEQYERLMKKPREVLSVILLVDTLVNILLIVLTVAIATSITIPFPYWVKTLFLFALIVVACDLVPKVLALRDPFRFARQAVTLLQFLLPFFGPLSRVTQRASEIIASFFLPTKPERVEQFNDEELIALVELSAEQGQLRADEQEMIEGIIKLGNKSVKDCMTPRVDAFFINDSMTNEEVIQQLRIKRRARVPVFGESPDEILGILDVKTFLADPSEHYTEQVGAPSFVPETMRALDLLRAFLKHPQRLAIVIDEFGGTEGVITLADILDEILAEVAPRGGEELYLEELGNGAWLACGSVRLEDLEEALHLDFDTEEFDTLNGLIFNRLGYVPRPGETVQVPPLELEVRESNRRRVVEVKLRRIEKKEAAQAA
ncbi:MAG: HlyC/CorC family transporter [Verrucomicrobia bacterium]|nr:HlyC/CorC family transporter [Verrucomicrobiota bacterium]